VAGEKLGLIHLVAIGSVEARLVEGLREPLAEQFGCSVVVAQEVLPLPAGAYDARRQQYRADPFVTAVHQWCARHSGKALGVTEVDLFVPELNFVFGQAEMGGSAAVMSLHRLRPEFYGGGPDAGLLGRRAATEAVHEVGHTFGLRHCGNPSCVMFFSNSIADTDRKGYRLCGDCRARLPLAR